MSLQLGKLKFQTVSLAQLVSSHPAAVLSQLKEAAGQGVFYVDLRGSEHLVAPTDVTQCFNLARELYTTSPDMLGKYDIDTIGLHKLDG